MLPYHFDVLALVIDGREDWSANGPAVLDEQGLHLPGFDIPVAAIRKVEQNRISGYLCRLALEGETLPHSLVVWVDGASGKLSRLLTEMTTR